MSRLILITGWKVCGATFQLGPKVGKNWTMDREEVRDLLFVRAADVSNTHI